MLLLDEPLGALDFQLRKTLQDELRAIQRRLGTTVVYVTHDQEEALALSHRIGLVLAGHLIQVSYPREIYDRSATRFVAEFIGNANLIDSSVARGLKDRAEAALAMLRPEDLELAKPEESMFVGTVSQTVFLGPHCRQEVYLQDGTVIWVYVDPDAPRPNGDRAGVRIRPKYGAVVRADEDVVKTEPAATAMGE